MPTFAVSSVEPLSYRFHETPLAEHVAPAPQRVEACSSPDAKVVRGPVLHGLLGAADLAFRSHRPLVLSPDHFWIVALQGWCTHLAAHPDTLRGTVIKHPGQKRLEVRRDELFSGAPASAWESVFTDFTAQIREDIGPQVYRDLMQGFSTTGRVERTVYDISLMASLEPYFAYHVLTMCGIPEVTLEGTQADWQLLQHRIEKLADLGLGFWVERVRPLLQEFVRVFDGHVDRQHWQNLYKMREESGEPLTITGWLGRFLPYLKGGPNDVDRLTVDLLPASTCTAGFEWQDQGRPRPMQAMAGLVGVQLGEGGLRPLTGWAVADLTAGGAELRRAAPVLRDYFAFLQLPGHADDALVRARVNTLVAHQQRLRIITPRERLLIQETWHIFKRPAQRAAYRRLWQAGTRQVDLVSVLQAAGLLLDYYGLLALRPDANEAELRAVIAARQRRDTPGYLDDALAILTTPSLLGHFQASTPTRESVPDSALATDLPAPTQEEDQDVPEPSVW